MKICGTKVVCRGCENLLVNLIGSTGECLVVLCCVESGYYFGDCEIGVDFVCLEYCRERISIPLTQITCPRLI